ncbi:odorant receptor 46a-like [Epargyreus clarus]|uniref:odorant receptor 46a-like n=1 Tax=Epargyreus clarus TaxID=520877 RepID=UPI003C2EF0C1
MYKSVDSFRPHFDALARVGYFKIGFEVFKPISYMKYRLHNCYRFLVWLLIITYNFQHVIRVVQARHSTDQMVDTLFILLTTLNTLGKQIAFNARARRIQRVITIIDGELFAARNAFHEGVLKTNGAAMSRLLALYHGAIFICSLLWTIFPLVNRALGYAVEFTAYIPFETTELPAFGLAVAYMSALIVVQAYGNVSMDCTIVAFYAQAKTQLKMLRFDLEHFIDSDNDINLHERKFIANRCNMYRDLDQNYRGLLKERLVSCVKHYEQIAWFVKEVESIFGEAMLVQFIVMAWVICMTVYKIIGLHILSAEFVSMAVYLGCMLAQLFIYCYYGTQLKVESDFVPQSVYGADWLCVSPQFRSNLLIIMARCHRPIEPRTAYIVPMSLETYIAVLRSSYTLFTFLERK